MFGSLQLGSEQVKEIKMEIVLNLRGSNEHTHTHYGGRDVGCETFGPYMRRAAMFDERNRREQTVRQV